MELKLFDSERKVMEVLWDAAQDLPAREVARRLEQSVGWNKNTTYTVIKKCVEKEAIERREPNFQCHPLVSREQVREQEAVDLVDKLLEIERSPRPACCLPPWSTERPCPGRRSTS